MSETGGEPYINLQAYEDPACTMPTRDVVLSGGRGPECSSFAHNNFVRLTVRTIAIENPAYGYLSDMQMTDDYPMYRLTCGIPVGAASRASSVSVGFSLLAIAGCILRGAFDR
uniref:Uncharacterized protein n=2 Tax=Pyrodinium bahamense TaxID=73915 RepID=A0A7R9ZVK7_9DINO|mmetsp:Transcript_11574/g.31656  ORF Transcript_11574/g.31656 Transcript_11574/m.31656 type:complete len:113 (+) Transcript_11574:60-398(+)